jgi:hypothetical protein
MLYFSFNEKADTVKLNVERLKWHCRTKKRFQGCSLAAEYAKGPDRFEGIKEIWTLTAKTPQWDNEYKAEGSG